MEMREGNLWKNIMLFSVPLMLTDLLQVFFNMADVAVVGKFAGPISLGAVGSTTILVMLTVGLIIGMSQGVNTLTARFIGAEDPESEHSCVHTGFIICLGMGIIVLILSLLFAEDGLRLLHTKDELIDEALIYVRIYMLGSPAVGIYNFGNSVLSAAGDTRKPLKILAIAGVLNVILNLVFVIGFNMAAAGVALASVISQCVSAVLILRAVMSTHEGYRLELKHLHFDGTMARRILAISVPSAIQFTLFSIANLFVQSAVNSFDHVTVEGNSAAANSDGLVYGMMEAFYTAGTSFIAQNYGAGNKRRVRNSYLVSLAYSAGIGILLGGALYLFGDQFLSIFTDDRAVIVAGRGRLLVMALSYWISAFMDNATAAARGLGKTAVPTVIVIMGTIVFRIIWIYTVFAHFHTMESLYILYPCAWVLTAVFENIYFFRVYRRL